MSKTIKFEYRPLWPTDHYKAGDEEWGAQGWLGVTARQLGKNVGEDTLDRLLRRRIDDEVVDAGEAVAYDADDRGFSWAAYND